MSQRPPLRLLDDPAAPRALRDDLARAAAHPVAPYDVAAGLVRFEQALTTGAASTGAASGAGGKTVLGAAIKGALLGVVAIGGAAIIDARAPAPTPVPSEARPATSAVTAPVRAAASAGTPSPDVRRDPSVTPLPAIAPPVSVATRPSSAPPVAESAPPPVLSVAPSSPESPAPGSTPASAPDAGDLLAQEVEHLARLRAVAGLAPVQALALATEGQQRFGSGLFAQEREAIAIAALVRLGRASEARARADVFLARYPRSSFAERIQEMIRASGAK